MYCYFHCYIETDGHNSVTANQIGPWRLLVGKIQYKQTVQIYIINMLSNKLCRGQPVKVDAIIVFLVAVCFIGISYIFFQEPNVWHCSWHINNKTLQPDQMDNNDPGSITVKWTNVTQNSKGCLVLISVSWTIVSSFQISKQHFYGVG